MTTKKITKTTSGTKHSKSKSSDSSIDFQQQFLALEKITEDFESGKYDLEKGLVKFEEGLQLAQSLKQHLEAVENRIETIKGKYNELTQETNKE